MKKLFTTLMMSALFIVVMNAQTLVTATDPINIAEIPTSCYGGTNECGDITFEYFITNLDVVAEDGLGQEIIGTAQSNDFTLEEYIPQEDLADVSNFAVTPICYNLNAVKLLVDGIVNLDACCAAVEQQGPGICEGIRSTFPNGGDDVHDMNDVLGVISAFSSSSVSIGQFQNIANTVNGLIGVLTFVCGNVETLDYCVNPTDSIVFVLDPVSVEDLEKDFSGVQVSPNPVNDLLNVNFSAVASKEVTITVSNTIGQVVSTQVVNAQQGENTTLTDMSALNPGIYMIAISDGTHIEVKKVMKQ